MRTDLYRRRAQVQLLRDRSQQLLQIRERFDRGARRGLDPHAIAPRVEHPDRNHYALVRGLVDDADDVCAFIPLAENDCHDSATERMPPIAQLAKLGLVRILLGL
jgi:hypothetical protein